MQKNNISSVKSGKQAIIKDKVSQVTKGLKKNIQHIKIRGHAQLILLKQQQQNGFQKYRNSKSKKIMEALKTCVIQCSIQEAKS